MSGVRVLNIAIEMWGVVFCAIGIACTVLFARADDRRYRKQIAVMFAIEMVSAGGDAAAGVFRGLPGTVAWIATHVGNLATFLASYLLLATFVSYLCNRLGEDDGPQLEVWKRIAWAVLLVWCLLAASGLFYTIDEANLYRRSDWYWLAQVPAVIISLGNMAVVLRYRKQLGGTALACMLFYTIAPVIASLMQIYVYGINFVDVVATVGLMVLFMEMQVHSARMLLETTEEVAQSRIEVSESRIAVMVSQIQPHFLFNTLDSIYYLCAEDPQRAQKAIDNFSTYLRANLNSLDQTVPVPIEAELGHVRTYLELEKMSMEDLLDYEIDAAATGFSVPALSVQTLAENAVKHGVGKKVGGGRVVVRTRERNDCYLVSVVDDGVGFDAETVFGRDHLGIENTRMRLRSMCDGALEITSTPGQGTSAVMTVPKSR